MRIVIFIVFILLATQCAAQKMINGDKLISDFDYTVQELKRQHQGFYNYTSQAETDAEIMRLRNRIGQRMPLLEFYQIIRELVGLMQEGHGYIGLPKSMMVKLGLSKSFFPLTIKFFDGEMVVTQNFGEEVEGLAKGAKIIAINGRPVDAVVKPILPMVITDGFIESARYEWIGGASFSLLYRLVYGKQSSFELEVLNYGDTKTKVVTVPAIKFTHFKSKRAKYKGWPVGYSRFGFKQVNDSIAYLSIPDFSDDAIDYDAFYENQFKKIDSLQIRHLIVDVQANTGGEEGNENLLFSYLSKDRLRKYQKVTMLPGPYEKRKDYKSIKFDKWALKGAIAERGDFTLYSDYYSNLGYAKPAADLVYEGKVYVLTSGLTFSGGAEFASMLKMTDRAVFIGEETGGAYEGNVSSFDERIKLPHTRIFVDIPMVHFQIAVTPDQRGRGVQPDHQVPQKWADYNNKENAKLRYAIELIVGN